jgi:ABC-type sugar transport system ATPase subunit
MNRGAIEQIGAPSEVYDRPRTLFAAGFIGSMNIMPARLVDGRLVAGQLRVAIDAGTAAALSRASELHAAIRPEDVTTAADFEQPDAVGSIEQVVKLGAIRLAVVDLGNGQRLKIHDMGRGVLIERATIPVHIGRLLVYRNGADPIEIVRARWAAALPVRRLGLPHAVGGR